MRRFVGWKGLLLLAGAPACLLYTDPINSPPQVTMIVAPQSFHSNQMATFQGKASDPDGDAVELLWATVDRECKAVSPADWDKQPKQSTSLDGQFAVTPRGHQPFCVRVWARDKHGATSDPREVEGQAQNQAPLTTLAVDPPMGMAGFPLYTAFRLTAGPVKDADGDPVEFTWKGTDPTGADMTAALTACDPRLPDSVRCFSAAKPGSYAITVETSDGLEKGTPKMVTLPVLEDGPPCIEVTDPAQETGVVVMAVTAPPRPFEVRRVRDDGNPFPAGPNGAASFQWFTARQGATSWTKELGYDRPVFDVSAGRFEDVRPGSVYRVRVEVRDPAHDSAAELRALEVACGDQDLCKLPEKCVRWVTWSVRFQ